LTDFGLSRELKDSKEELRLKIYGRLGYLDPELFEKKGNSRPPFECRHDIYGLAVLYWEIMYGGNPTEDGYRINQNRFCKIEECPEEFHQLYIHCQKPAQGCSGQLLEKYEPCEEPSERPSADQIVGKLKLILCAYPSRLKEQKKIDTSSTDVTSENRKQIPASSVLVSVSGLQRQCDNDNTDQLFKQDLELYLKNPETLLKNPDKKTQDKVPSIGDLKKISAYNFDSIHRNVQNEKNFKRWCLRIRVKMQGFLKGSPFGISTKEMELFFEQKPETLSILKNFMEKEKNLGIKR